MTTGSRRQLAILIVGMHRSGTSALAGTLTKLGIKAPGQLLSPDEYNEKGYFENERIVQLHDRLLAELGSSWCDPMPLSTTWIDSAIGQAAVEEVMEVVDEEFGGVPAFVVKDPRLCRLMPLWQNALERLGKDIKIVLPVRHPLEVARSINSRNGLPFLRCQMLWLQYVLSAEAATRTLPRSFISYEDMLHDWRSSLAKVASELELTWPRDFERAAMELDDFVSPILKHAETRGWHTGMSPIDRLCSAAWEAYKNLQAAPYGKEAIESLDHVARSLGEAFAIVGPLLLREIEWNDAHHAEITEADRQRAEAEVQNISLRVQMSDMRAKVQSLQVKLAKQTIDMKLSEELAAHRAWLESVRSETDARLMVLDTKLHDLNARVDSTAQSARRFEAIMSTRFMQIPRLFYRGYRRLGRFLGRG